MPNKLNQFLQYINPFNRSIDPATVKKNLANVISPVQLQRVRQDVLSWRDSQAEAENAWYPHRIKQQRLYIDTKLNGHVISCMERRKDLTLLRKFELVGPDGKIDDAAMLIFCDVVEKDGVKSMSPKKWFSDFISYSLDALFYGYTLVSLGDVVNDSFPAITPIKRWNISPDRLNVTTFTYSISGYYFTDEPYKDWHIWIPTTNDIATSTCGYGILYPVALYEIFLRNLIGYNGDFLEMYAQPYRVGKTQKTEEGERNEFAAQLRDLGSSGWAMMDPQDTIEFIETALGGTGYKGYDNLEARCEKKISKIILGHADAMDSTPGKLGSGQGGVDQSPVQQALNDKQTKDGVFIEGIINGDLISRMITLGFNLPQGVRLKFSNDAEQQEIRKREDESNKETADIMKTVKDAGGKPDWDWFNKRTGMKVSEAPLPATPAPFSSNGKPALSESVKNKLNELYR